MSHKGQFSIGLTGFGYHSAARLEKLVYWGLYVGYGVAHWLELQLRVGIAFDEPFYDLDDQYFAVALPIRVYLLRGILKPYLTVCLDFGIEHAENYFIASSGGPGFALDFSRSFGVHVEAVFGGMSSLKADSSSGGQGASQRWDFNFGVNFGAACRF